MWKSRGRSGELACHRLFSHDTLSGTNYRATNFIPVSGVFRTFPCLRNSFSSPSPPLDQIQFQTSILISVFVTRLSSYFLLFAVLSFSLSFISVPTLFFLFLFFFFFFCTAAFKLIAARLWRMVHARFCLSFGRFAFSVYHPPPIPLFQSFPYYAEICARWDCKYTSLIYSMCTLWIFVRTVVYLRLNERFQVTGAVDFVHP